MEISASGDLEVDGHHTVEDTGIVLGQALSKALGENQVLQGMERLLSLWTSLSVSVLWI